jgi:hypothetical protein
MNSQDWFSICLPLFMVFTIWGGIWTAAFYDNFWNWSLAQKVFAFIISGPMGWLLIIGCFLVTKLREKIISPFWNWLGKY